MPILSCSLDLFSYCKKAKTVLKELNLPEGKEIKIYGSFSPLPSTPLSPNLPSLARHHPSVQDGHR